MKLSIGMAHYNDFEGLWATVQALRLYHAEVMADAEIIVVDNNPGSEHGKMAANLPNWVRCLRHVPVTGVTGTSRPRDMVFNLARGEVVVVMDCHVFLAPGSLKRLLGYYDAHPGCRDLLSGPMLYDNLESVSTHFNDEWRAEMWGTWGTDRRGLDPDGEPFEIGAMGLGLFSCRKDAWLGFNENFRGFGGEEWYIHTKFRQAGARCLCLPFLRWAHRFGRPGGAPYPLKLWDKVRNYVIGHRELGLPLDRVHQHFVGGGRMGEVEWNHILAGATEPPRPQAQPDPCKGCGAKIPDSLEAWYTQARDTSSDINEHVPRLRELASGRRHVVEFGVRAGVSTVALLAGQPERMTSYDLNTPREASGLQTLMGGTQFRFIQGDSRQVEIEPCDLLFIDTRHTADQLYAELSRHAPKCKGRIVLHDTETFGENGEGGGPGLLPALRRYLQEHPEWSVIEHRRNNHGLTVLSNDPADSKKLPSAWQQRWNFMKAQTRHLINGGRFLPLPLAEERLAICTLCDQRSVENCAQCGCYLWRVADHAPVNAGQPGKVFYPTEFCPLGKWHARPDDGVSMTADDIKRAMAPLE